MLNGRRVVALTHRHWWFLESLIPSKSFIWSQMIFPLAFVSTLLPKTQSKAESFAKPPSREAFWMVLIYSPRKTILHLFIGSWNGFILY